MTTPQPICTEPSQDRVHGSARRAAGPYPGKQYLIGGNWKCNGTKESTAALVATLNGAGDIPAWCEVVVGVPSIHIGSVMGTLRKDIAIAAQDCSATGMGAYTGELSAAMLADYGVKWVILGHSERRTNQGESSALVATKTKQALDAGLSVMRDGRGVGGGPRRSCSTTTWSARSRNGQTTSTPSSSTTDAAA